MRDTVRAGATAVGVASGLMILASTAQTPDGYLHASFGGPMDFFSSNGTADVVAIGDGTNDVSEIAALLKGPLGPAATTPVPDSPYRVAYEAGAAPNPTTDSTVGLPPTEMSPPITAAPTSKDAAILPSKPVIDSHGKIDCRGSVSCRTDPVTNITTVAYPDGVIAIVQKINDLTVVAYKTITEALPAEVSALLPPVPSSTPPLEAAAAPPPAPTIAPTKPVITSIPDEVAPAPETSSAFIDPGPPAPDIDLDLEKDVPKVNVTTPPKDFSPGTDESVDVPALPAPKVPNFGGKVKDTIGGVVDAVKGAVGKALGPGASTSDANDDSAPDAPSSKDSSTGSQDAKSGRPGGDNSDGS